MTDLAIYHLIRRTTEQTLGVLLEKCLERGWRVLILADHEDRLKSLDSALWTVSDTSFLPHCFDDDEALDDHPIVLALEDRGQISPEVTIHVNRFDLPRSIQGERLIYLFADHDEEARNSARSLWREAHTADLSCSYWQEGSDGRFVKRQ